MPFGVDEREFTSYVGYVYIIFGLAGLLVLALCLPNLDALSFIGLNAFDLFISSIFDLVVFAVIYTALDKGDISDFEFSIILVLIAFLDLIIFHNLQSAMRALLVLVAASGFIIDD